MPAPLDAADPRLVEVYDDVPLWSAPFGLTLLEMARLRPGLSALDVGCGTGFPLVELAQRLGPGSRVVGLDPWRPALERVRRKREVWDVPQLELVEGSAEAIPLPDAGFDLVVSNNGLNNVADPGRALRECARVARAGAQLVFTFNLPDTFRELYDPLAAVLRERGDAGAEARIAAHVAARRQPLAAWRPRLAAAGWHVGEVRLGSFALRFAGAAALLAHGFMRLAFVPSWRELLPPADAAAVEEALRERLDAQRGAHGLVLTVPYACVDATRA